MKIALKKEQKITKLNGNVEKPIFYKTSTSDAHAQSRMSLGTIMSAFAFKFQKKRRMSPKDN